MYSVSEICTTTTQTMIITLRRFCLVGLVQGNLFSSSLIFRVIWWQIHLWEYTLKKIAKSVKKFRRYQFRVLFTIFLFLNNIGSNFLFQIWQGYIPPNNMAFIRGMIQTICYKLFWFTYHDTNKYWNVHQSFRHSLNAEFWENYSLDFHFSFNSVYCITVCIYYSISG